MLKKLYVRQTTEKTVDGDKLQIVEVLPSQVKKTKYIVFLEK